MAVCKQQWNERHSQEVMETKAIVVRESKYEESIQSGGS